MTVLEEREELPLVVRGEKREGLLQQREIENGGGAHFILQKANSCYSEDLIHVRCSLLLMVLKGGEKGRGYG